MALYTIADLHLSLSCDKPMDIFGSRWKNHTSKIEGLWNNIVTPDDTVVIGGDISWALTVEQAYDDLRFIHSLPGKKILLRGNHDFWWSSLKKITDFFDSENISDITLLQNNSVNCENFVIAGTRGWYNDPQAASGRSCDNKKIIAREALRLGLSLKHAAENSQGRELIVFTHFPPRFSDFVCPELISVMKTYGVRRCYFGHIHGVYNIPAFTLYEGIEYHIVSADYLDFRPLLISPAM